MSNRDILSTFEHEAFKQEPGVLPDKKQGFKLVSANSNVDYYKIKQLFLNF